jgi:phosphopantetheinyl transferase
MATHFARGILTEGRLASVRLSSACHNQARTLPEHRRTRFLASRALLAELMFMLYVFRWRIRGISWVWR